MDKRYQRNMNMLSEAEINMLHKSRVCVIGCGGLGGYVIEMLGRLGVGHITAIDGDVFDETNLNRQLLSSVDVIGMGKAETAKKRMQLVNPSIEVTPVSQRVTSENGMDILAGHDVIIDAVDSIDTRLLLQDLASRLETPLVHGAIGGWFGQVTTIFPEDRTLDKLYAKSPSRGIEKELGNPSFTPAIVASLEVSEVLKILIGRGELLRKKVLYIDTFEQDYMVVDI